jgi:hypothetical protein
MPNEPPKRTIDERIDGLTQTLELLASIVKDNEQRHAREMAEIRAALAADGEHIRGLARIAELHSQRMDDHQQGIEGLEDQ